MSGLGACSQLLSASDDGAKSSTASASMGVILWLYGNNGKTKWKLLHLIILGYILGKCRDNGKIATTIS